MSYHLHRTSGGRSAEVDRGALSTTAGTVSDAPRRPPLDELHQSAQDALRRNDAAEALKLARRALARSTRDPRSRAHCYYIIAAANIMLSNFEDGLAALRKVREANLTLGDRALEARALSQRAILHQQRGEFDKVRRYAAESLKVAELAGEARLAMQALTYIANACCEFGEYSKALEYYGECLAFFEEQGPRMDLAVILGSMGKVCRMMRDFENALGYFLRSVEIFEECGARIGHALSLCHLALTHGDREEWDSALEYYHRALDLQRETGNAAGEGDVLLGMGRAWYRKGEYAAARRHLEEASAIARRHKIQGLLLNTALYTGSVHMALREYDAALELFEMVMSSAERLGLPHFQRDAAAWLSEWYERRGESGRALEYFKIYHDIQAGLDAESRTRMAGWARASREVKRVEQEREAYRLKSERLQAEVKRITRELSATTMHLKERNEFLEMMRKRIPGLLQAATLELREPLQDLAAGLDSLDAGGPGWSSFMQRLDDATERFITILAQRYPGMSPAQMKVSSLLRLGLSTKEIASLLSISPRSVEDHRYEIRKKVGLRGRGNLNAYLASL